MDLVQPKCYYRFYRFTTAHGPTGRTQLHPLFRHYRVSRTCGNENGHWKCPPRT